MTTPSTVWLAQVMSIDTPLLPSASALLWGRPFAWVVVLSALLCYLLARGWPRTVGVAWIRWLVLAVTGACVFLWGSYSPAFGLALIFQMPSLTAVVLCAVYFTRVSRGGFATAPDAGANRELPMLQQPWHLGLVGMAVLLGWVLMLDTFAALPIQWYAWGFAPAAPAVAMLVLLLPWVFCRDARQLGWSMWVLPCAIVLFVVSRFPTGNLWDALLDPCLWLILQGLLVRETWRRLKSWRINKQSGTDT